MSWVAVGVGAATLIGGLVSSNQQKKAAQGAANKPQLVYNAYGELNTPATGAITSRDTIFNQMNSDAFQKRVAANTDAYSSAIGNAAYGKDMQDISAYGSNVLNGKYLQSPVVANYARGANKQIMAGNADQLARTQAMFARNGMGFSTTMQQAQQADKAAAAAKGASLESQILANNYQNERALQSAAPSIITGAQNQKLSYLAGLNGALYSPLQMQAGLTTQLLGNNQIKDPTYIQTPTTADAFNNGMSSAVGMYSMYKGLNSGNTSKPAAGSSAGQLSYWNGTDASGNDIWAK